MVIISDTSPIVNLAAIGKLDLIPALFEKVYLPVAVFEEIVVKGANQPGAAEIQNASWIEIKSCTDQNLLQKLLLELDPGESEAIALAIEMDSPNILMDEKDGREVAMRYNLKPIGLLGILLEAKKSGLLRSVQQCMDDLKNSAGFYIAEPLYRQVLILAAEQS
jgi:predicted nucleic acid-binding protein